MPRLTVVIDCKDAEKLSEFWAAPLGYTPRPKVESFVVLLPPREERLTSTFLILQEVPEPKRGKNRVHVDVPAHDLEAEASRIESLGGRRLSADPLQLSEDPDTRWMVMADPEGNEFCLHLASD